MEFAPRAWRIGTMRQHVIAVLLSSLASLGFAGVHRAPAADRSPEEILKKIEEVKFPEQDQTRIGDDDYGREWRVIPTEDLLHPSIEG
jgi:hypothetical protein